MVHSSSEQIKDVPPFIQYMECRVVCEVVTAVKANGIRPVAFEISNCSLLFILLNEKHVSERRGEKELYQHSGFYF